MSLPIQVLWEVAQMKPIRYTSFEDLRDLSRSSEESKPPVSEPPRRPQISEDLSDEELFERSMRDVVRLGWSATPLPPAEPIEIPNPQQSEDEGLRLLKQFLEGKSPVDLVVSGEYIEGASSKQGRLLLNNLRSGHFAVEDHLDLHGLSLAEAKDRFEAFIRSSLQRSFGCVRIVHGRGHHSADGRAVLKEQVQRWLSTRRMSRHVVAFTSAHLSDGGGGAVYVLLRRRKLPHQVD